MGELSVVISIADDVTVNPYWTEITKDPQCGEVGNVRGMEGKETNGNAPVRGEELSVFYLSVFSSFSVTFPPPPSLSRHTLARQYPP